MNKFHTTMAMLVLAGTASVALADGEGEEEAHADVMVLVSPTGELMTGVIDFDEQAFEGFARVYESEFEVFDLGGGVSQATTDEPGFNALANGNATLPAGYTSLDAGTALTFDAAPMTVGGVTSNLFFWDGVGAVDFAPATGSLDITKAPDAVFNATLDGSSGGVSGFEIDVAGADGSAHQHLDLTIPNSHLLGDGFLLWSFVLSTSDGKQAEPIFFVHGLGIENEAQHEAAVDWVTFNLVPSPGAAIFALAGFGAIARRRRA